MYVSRDIAPLGRQETKLCRWTEGKTGPARCIQMPGNVGEKQLQLGWHKHVAATEGLRLSDDVPVVSILVQSFAARASSWHIKSIRWSES